jgi:hypothetical protein
MSKSLTPDGERATIRRRIRNDDHDPGHTSVPLLSADLALHRLQVVKASLRLDGSRGARRPNDRIPRPKVPRDRKGDLGAPATGLRETSLKTLKQGDLGGVSDGVAVRVASDHELQTDDRARSGEDINGYAAEAPAFDPTHGRVAHACGSANGDLAQTSSDPGATQLLADIRKRPGRKPGCSITRSLSRRHRAASSGMSIIRHLSASTVVAIAAPRPVRRGNPGDPCAPYAHRDGCSEPHLESEPCYEPDALRTEEQPRRPERVALERAGSPADFAGSSLARTPESIAVTRERGVSEPGLAGPPG